MTRPQRILLAVAAGGALCMADSLLRSRASDGAFAYPAAGNGRQPVPAADIERMARIPYQSSTANAGCVGMVAGCTFLFSPAPAGYRLVVENLSGWFQLAAGAAPPVVLLKDSSAHAALGFTAAVGQAVNNTVAAALNQPARAWFDPSDGSILAAVTASFPAVSAAQRMTLSGYLENCSITGCPPIQR